VIEAVETVIVGGGQAGLALSYHLRRLGREHVVLERGRLAERWRSERWDSLAFQFPSWSIRLPGHAYETDDPEGFAPRDEVVRFLERYREVIRAPVRTGVGVLAVTARPGRARFLVETDGGGLEAANVVAATGPYQEPALPAAGAAMPSSLFQVHSSRYRNPGALPPGAVLVVGSGASGCQIAEDLVAAGRHVYLSVGRHARMPRRYRGHDIFWWLDLIGRLDQTVDDRPPSKRGPNPLVTGAGGGHDIDLRRYAADGMVLLGHLRGVHGGHLALAPDLGAELARGDEAFAAVTAMVDEHVLKTGLDAPPADPIRAAPAGRGPRIDSPRELDLAAAGVTSIVWATGYRTDFGWIRLPVFDERGEPVYRRGVTACPGLYFLGLPWLWKLKSSVLCGVGEDAEHIAEDIEIAAVRLRPRRA
jgi:putative flavoprotein involved in K+ transport